MIEDNLEADVSRIKAKWFGAGTVPRRTLDHEEEAIAAKWLGVAEARRLAETRTHHRYRPPVVVGHFGYIPPAIDSQDRYWVGNGHPLGD